MTAGPSREEIRRIVGGFFGGWSRRDWHAVRYARASKSDGGSA